MASIPSGAITHGASTSWLTLYTTASDRSLVLNTSVTGHKMTLNVSRKIFKKNAARPFDVLQLTIKVTCPVEAADTTLGYVDDIVTHVVNMPIVNANGRSFSVRLSALMYDTLVYLVGGFTDADITALSSILGDNIADQLMIGII